MFGVPRDLNRADKMNPERPPSSADVHIFGSAPPTITSPVSNDLVVRALNYHGQQLTSFMKEKKIYQQLDLKNVDYHLYHQRSRELKMEDRGKRLLLHRYQGYMHRPIVSMSHSPIILGLYHRTVTSCSMKRSTPTCPPSGLTMTR